MKSLNLSVVIPNYNHGKFLSDLLPALLAQTRPPEEIVIVDDGSTDNSVSIIESFAKNHSSIRLFRNEKNKGVIYTLNRAMSFTRCQYVTFPSADNFIKQGMYEKSLALLEQYPQAGMCCSDPLYLDEKSGKIHMNQLKLSDISRYFSPKEVVALYKKKGFCVGNICHTAVIKKDVLISVAGGGDCFNPELKWHADFFALNAVAFRSGICYLPEGFGIWRQDPDSYSLKPTFWKVRKKIYLRMWEILDNPLNKDIKQGFRESGIFAEFTYSVLGVLLFHPRYYGYFTKSYTKKAFKASAQALFWMYAPKIPFARKIYRFFKQLKVRSQ